MISIIVDGKPQDTNDYLIIDLRKLTAKDIGAILTYRELDFWTSTAPAKDFNRWDSITAIKDKDSFEWYVIVTQNNNTWEYGPLARKYADIMANELRQHLGDEVTVEGR